MTNSNRYRCVYLRAASLLCWAAPSSGKSSFLRMLPQLNPDAGHWLWPEPGNPSAAYWSGVLRQAAAGSLIEGSVALVDDADLLPHDVNRCLADLNALGVSVVMTAGYSPLLSQRVPLALQARNLGTGVLIAPGHSWMAISLGCGSRRNRIRLRGGACLSRTAGPWLSNWVGLSGQTTEKTGGLAGPPTAHSIANESAVTASRAVGSQLQGRRQPAAL